MIQLSIIIPAYNAERWIEQLIHSLAKQQVGYFDEFEVIITDDGSTDNTAQVVESCLNKYPNLQLLLLRQRNLGVSAARNYGIERACGRFCWFVDADDMVVPYAMKHLIPLLRHFEGDVVQMGPCVYGYLVGDNLLNLPTDETDDSVGVYVNGSKLLEGDGFGHTTFLWKRKVIVEHRLRYPENIQNNEDFLFIIRYLCLCGDVYVNQSMCFYLYRHHDTSLSRGNLKDFRFIDHKLRNQMLVFEMLCKDRQQITNPQLLASFDCALTVRAVSVVGALIVYRMPVWCRRYFLARLKATGYYPFHATGGNPLLRIASRNSSMLMLIAKLYQVPGFSSLGKWFYKRK